jgi:hypothetical protein
MDRTNDNVDPFSDSSYPHETQEKAGNHPEFFQKMKQLEISEAQALKSSADSGTANTSYPRTPLRTEFRHDQIDSRKEDMSTAQNQQHPADGGYRQGPPSAATHSAHGSKTSLTASISPTSPQKSSIESGTFAGLERISSKSSAVNDEALRIFADSVQHYFKLFRLAAETTMPLSATPSESLTRAASWWFLRGRTAIEQYVRRRATQPNIESMKEMGHIDLAKCVWILEEVLMQRAEIESQAPEELAALEVTARQAGHTDLARILERYQQLYSHLRKLTASMRKNNCMPPDAENAVLIQGLDPSIWVPYPWRTPELQNLLSNHDPATVLSPEGRDVIPLADTMPLGDSASAFVYSRQHVSVYLLKEGHDAHKHRIPCLLTIQRPHDEHAIAAMITSQDGVVAVYIQHRREFTPSWQDVKWKVDKAIFDVRLSQGIVARVVFPPGDLPQIWNLWEYTSKVQKMFRPQEDEALLLETTLKSAQYLPTEGQGKVFPTQAVPNCRARIFEQMSTEKLPSGQRLRYRGLRIALITPRETKMISGLAHALPASRPMVLEHLRPERGPCLQISFDDGPPAKLALSFATNQDRSAFHNCLVGGQRQVFDSTLATIPTSRILFVGTADPDAVTSRSVLDDLSWRGTTVVRHRGGAELRPNGPETPEHLRIICETSDNQRLIDRLMLTPGSGEVRFRLGSNPTIPDIALLRGPQTDLAVAVNESRTPAPIRQGFHQLLTLASRLPTIRTYSFPNPQEMHTFLSALTSHDILYDGVASTFSISHRRSMVPVTKKREAVHPRILVLGKSGVVQVVVFFEDFAMGECMRFGVRATDVLELSGKGGRCGVKFVDAKFALPKGGKKDREREREMARSRDGEGVSGSGRNTPAPTNGEEDRFVCLDAEEYATEHDDIVVVFDGESGMNPFSIICVFRGWC